MSKKKKVTDLTEQELAHAKQQYMEYKNISDIADQLGVARTSLSYHVNKKWKAEREVFKAELMHNFAANKRANFINISDSSIKVLQRALTDLANREIPPTMKEAKDAAAVIEALDKILRLDDNKPTDIISNQDKPIAQIDLRKKLSLDPFAELEEGEYKEIESEEDSGTN